MALRFSTRSESLLHFLSSSCTFQWCRNVSLSHHLLAGHNKWSKVKNIKIPLDAKRATDLNKYIAQINNIFVHDKNATLESNFQLQKVFQSALESGHTKVKLMNAIENARKARPEAVTVKISAPVLNVHFFVKGFCMFRDETQLLNRTIKKFCEKQSLVRQAQSINAGYVDDIFEPKTVASVISNNGSALSEDQAFEIGDFVNAEEIEFNDDSKEWLYINSGVEYQKMKTLIEKHDVTVTSCEVVLVPYVPHQFAKPEDYQAAESLFSTLSSIDNVDSVYKSYDDTLKT